jgi:hypothetical protein
MPAAAEYQQHLHRIFIRGGFAQDLVAARHQRIGGQNDSVPIQDPCRLRLALRKNAYALRWSTVTVFISIQRYNLKRYAHQAKQLFAPWRTGGQKNRRIGLKQIQNAPSRCCPAFQLL